MHLVQFVFQPEAAAALLILISLLIVVMVLSKYSKQAPTLKSRMKKSEDSLTALRDRNKTQKQTIEELQKQVKPLQQQEPKFREYSEALSALLAEADEKVAKEEEQKEIKRAEHF